VAILTTQAADQQHGMTVNSFTSVSLTPPLILVSLEHTTRTHALVQQAGFFALSILGHQQAAVSDHFAGRHTEDTPRLAGFATRAAVTGAPILTEAVAYVDCVVQAAHPEGTHTLYIAEVVAAQVMTSTSPLIYFDRGYHTLT
jgi:flavin reductase (DIM6/NTAB) family NADH-FMN oxidoreductase RutF